jgi:hypothetical protein
MSEWVRVWKNYKKVLYFLVCFSQFLFLMWSVGWSTNDTDSDTNLDFLFFWLPSITMSNNNENTFMKFSPTLYSSLFFDVDFDKIFIIFFNISLCCEITHNNTIMFMTYLCKSTIINYKKRLIRRAHLNYNHATTTTIIKYHK